VDFSYLAAGVAAYRAAYFSSLRSDRRCRVLFPRLESRAKLSPPGFFPRGRPVQRLEEFFSRTSPVDAQFYPGRFRKEMSLGCPFKFSFATDPGKTPPPPPRPIVVRCRLARSRPLPFSTRRIAPRSFFCPLPARVPFGVSHGKNCALWHGSFSLRSDVLYKELPTAVVPSYLLSPGVLGPFSRSRRTFGCGKVRGN